MRYHLKRVTLNLGRLSECVPAEVRELLGLVHEANYDLSLIGPKELEAIYAEFDEELEKKIVSEWVADPSKIHDLKGSGFCQLCGHSPIRWEFVISNRVNDARMHCGSRCIFTYGLCVRGAETAAEAKKILEKRIREEIKRLKLEAWHEEFCFSERFLHNARVELRLAYQSTEAGPEKDVLAVLLFHELPALREFYNKSGWLGTEKKWKRWCAVAFTLRLLDADSTIPVPRSWHRVMSTVKPLPVVEMEPQPVQLSLVV